MDEVSSAVDRLQAAHREFDRVAGETLAMLRAEDVATQERSERMRQVTLDAIAAIDNVLAMVR
jgi:hypothetical protein